MGDESSPPGGGVGPVPSLLPVAVPSEDPARLDRLRQSALTLSEHVLKLVYRLQPVVSPNRTAAAALADAVGSQEAGRSDGRRFVSLGQASALLGRDARCLRRLREREHGLVLARRWSLLRPPLEVVQGVLQLGKSLCAVSVLALLRMRDDGARAGLRQHDVLHDRAGSSRIRARRRWTAITRRSNADGLSSHASAACSTSWSA